MSKSLMMRPGDARSIVNLIGECRDLGDDWWAWQRHWVDGLLKPTGSELGIGGEVGEIHSFRKNLISPPVMLGRPGFDVDPTRIVTIINEFSAAPGMSQFIDDYCVKLAEEDGVALTNRDLYRDRDWRGSLDMQTVGRAYGTDSTLLCCRQITRAMGDEVLNVTLFREVGRRPFAARECTITHEAIAALTPLMGGPLARFIDPSPAALPPRVRQVLACFLEGDGDKQVAARLGISTHTVNQYAKLIFLHFGVRSRTELLARWIRRGWGDKFPWVD